ncbi:MAG: hypothetical protein RRC34_03775 [Lentisphaeria bacterium]|nr:hypothetical protein [Lentisphaeria bacterium]
MSLATAVSSVKCPVCRVDMSAVGEVAAAKPVPAAPPAPSSAPAAAAPAPASAVVPSGIKIAQAVAEHPKHGGMGPSAVSTANVEAAAHKLMASARAEADKVIQAAESQRAEILAHAEAHAREQVEAFFEQARTEAAETEKQAKTEAEEILAAARRDAVKIAEDAVEKARSEAAAQLAEERKTLADLKADMDKTGQAMSAKAAQDTPPQTVETQGGAADSHVETSGMDITALTKSAVENAIREDREKSAKKALQSRKTEADNYAKREARFIFAGSVFGALVLAYCVFILSQNASSLLRLMTVVMIGLDAVIFAGLVGIIIGHYKAGSDVIKKQKRTDKKAVRPAVTAPGQTPLPQAPAPTDVPENAPVEPIPAESPVAPVSDSDSAAPAPSSAETAPDDEPPAETAPKKTAVKMKLTVGKSPGVKGTKPANEALRKAAMRAAAKRAAGKK